MSDQPNPTPSINRDSWFKRVKPLERFLKMEASSGIVLLGAAIVALLWANSRWREGYAWLLKLKVGGSWAGTHTPSFEFWVNDVLMTLFFFVAGLEIRRELYRGELSEWRRAALPFAAALGGMLVPALIYILFNQSALTHRGWGVPVATDIAFAVGALTILGKRVPSALRVLLLALAVIDDIGGIIVIAVAYAARTDFLALLGALLGVGLILVMQRVRVRQAAFYGLPALLIWGSLYKAGIHPTMAGVVVGLLTPAAPLSPNEMLSPSERLQQALHGWVAFGIMPLFALVNAGVTLTDAKLSPDTTPVLLGVIAGLVVGKPVGIVLASWLGVTLRLAALPRGVDYRGIGVVGLVGGIGFTVALFVAGLAFADQSSLLNVAKVGILLGSFTSALLGLALGAWVFRADQALPTSFAQSADEAEASTID